MPDVFVDGHHGQYRFQIAVRALEALERTGRAVYDRFTYPDVHALLSGPDHPEYYEAAELLLETKVKYRSGLECVIWEGESGDLFIGTETERAAYYSEAC